MSSVFSTKQMIHCEAQGKAFRRSKLSLAVILRKGMEVKMDVNTIQLLKECSSGCQMAQKSVKHVREYTTDEKLNELLEAYGEKHSKLEREIADLLDKYHKDEEEPGKMAAACAWMSVEMKMMMHPDNHQVAKLMMDGCNMGIQSVSEYVNKYPDASGESQEIAKKLIKIEEDFMQEMKGFV